MQPEKRSRKENDKLLLNVPEKVKEKKQSMSSEHTKNKGESQTN